MVPSEKSQARVTKHDDQSKEHHEGANFDQSCRSERFIVEKCPMRYESIGSREFDEQSESEFLVSTIEAFRKNLAPKCNVKHSGGLILAECVGRLDVCQMTGRVFGGYHEKGRQASLREAYHYSSRGTQFAHCVLPVRCHRWNVDLPKEFKTARPSVQESLPQFKSE